MNIILEDNINFYDELNKSDDEDEDDENICLLSNMPLDKNCIKLPCNHTFNFYPLYKEVINQKTYTPSSHLNTDRLYIHQIKCPYCRQKCDYLLPHVKINDNIKFIIGVNSPEKYCMPWHTCEYIMKSGKNKNNKCSKSAYYIGDKCYCDKHHSIIKKKEDKANNNKNVKSQLNSSGCICILKSGKRKGEKCGIKIFKNNFCKRHFKSNENIS